MSTRRNCWLALILLVGLASGARRADAQAAAVEIPPMPLQRGQINPPGGTSSRLGPAPGSGADVLGTIPGAGDQLFGGRPGPGVPRVPQSITQPGGAGRRPAMGRIAPPPR